MKNNQVKTDSLCPACGGGLARANGENCPLCGKLLQEGYFPLDNLRASYRNKLADVPANTVAPLYEENKNTAAETAWAFVVYSMVPYLGILFCPGALIMGGVGLAVWRKRPELGGKRVSLYGMAGSLVILSIQLLLWWLLYLIPELAKQGRIP